ncbi:hypothetical protein Q9233_017426, partial [Columba guinea]
VTVAELRLRPELDTDGDGAVSEDEAQALLGDTTPLDAAAFRDRLWATLRERYRPQPPLEETPPEEEEDEDEAEEEEEEEEDSEGPEEELKTWGAWAGPEHDRFSAMKYEHGTGCWQGPNRATTVKLSCGTDTAVTATTEPSRCEYLMELVTPAACRAPPPAHDDHDEL